MMQWGVGMEIWAHVTVEGLFGGGGNIPGLAICFREVVDELYDTMSNRSCLGTLDEFIRRDYLNDLVCKRERGKYGFVTNPHRWSHLLVRT